MDWKDRVEQIKKNKLEFKTRKKQLKDNLNTNKDDTEFKEKVSKKVKDYFKFMHDQLKEMYEGAGSVHELSDREKDNFYKQVKEMWKHKKSNLEKPLSSSLLNKYILTDHFIERMFERKVTPKKVIEVLENGKQIKIFGTKYLVTKGTIMIPLDTGDKKLKTVMREDKYLNMSEKDFIIEQMAKLRQKRVFGKKQLTVMDLRKMDSLDDLKRFLGDEE